MKTFAHLLVATFLLTTCSAPAQNLWERMGAGGTRFSKAQLEQMRQQALRTQSLRQLEARRDGNPATTFFRVDFEPLHRVVEGRAVSLHPMLYWRNAGLAYWEAYQPFAFTNPMPGWVVVEGRVASLRKDIVIIKREADLVALRNWPGAKTALTDEVVRVLAWPSGRYQSGYGALLELDHGAVPTAAEAEALAKADAQAQAHRSAARAKAEAAAADAAAEAEARRKAEIAAKVEKARADRAAKEAKEKIAVGK